MHAYNAIKEGEQLVTVSVCMIVKDEEMVLARCLETVKSWVDEMIIVDTGSTDGTKEIARRYTDRVYDFAWRDDFAAARNFAFSKARCDYCMWLDADDVILPEDQVGFVRLKETLDKTTDIVMLPYHIAFDAQGNPTFSYYRERWIANGRGHCWVGAVHEVIVPCGIVLHSDAAAVCHKKLVVRDPQRNLRIFQACLARGEELDARQQFYYGKELFEHGQVEQAAQQLMQCLVRTDTWKENKIEACKLLYRCRRQCGETETALQALLQSFWYDEPRAEICCELGNYFLQEQALEQAIYWYRAALHVPHKEIAGGFVQPDFYDYVPYLQLCVCYDRLGDYETARDYNEKAGSCKPQSQAYLQNKAYFEQLQ